MVHQLVFRRFANFHPDRYDVCPIRSFAENPRLETGIQEKIEMGVRGTIQFTPNLQSLHSHGVALCIVHHFWGGEN